MERGELVPDELDDRDVHGGAGSAGRRRAARSSTASRAPWARPRALDETLAGQRRADPARDLHRGADRGARAPRGRALDLPDSAERRTTRTPTRRAFPGSCDRDGTPLRQRDDDRPEVVRARLEQPGAADARGRRPLRARRDRRSPRRHAADRGGHRGDPRRASAHRRRADADGHARRRRGHHQARQPRSTACARAGAILAGILDVLRAEMRPGVTTGGARPHRGADDPRRRRRPLVQGLRQQPAVSRRRSAPASTTRSCTASRRRAGGLPTATW